MQASRIGLARLLEAFTPGDILIVFVNYFKNGRIYPTRKQDRE